ncbi:hypothetical protein [Streptomyces sp. NBC_00470]|uniref:hypothetical protein n=1 Tax=Streptomyces sp. NBC_00470 TaxID=2975753 RepID=UPI002F9103CE
MTVQRRDVARLTRNGETHAIRAGWSFATIRNARTVCGRPGPFPVEYWASGRLITVTCSACTIQILKQQSGA